MLSTHPYLSVQHPQHNPSKFPLPLPQYLSKYVFDLGGLTRKSQYLAKRLLSYSRPIPRASLSDPLL